MIERIIKIAPSHYVINDVITVKINKDSSLEISYDEKDFDIDEVYEIIQEFLEI